MQSYRLCRALRCCRPGGVGVPVAAAVRRAQPRLAGFGRGSERTGRGRCAAGLFARNATYPWVEFRASLHISIPWPSRSMRPRKRLILRRLAARPREGAGCIRRLPSGAFPSWSVSADGLCFIRGGGRSIDRSVGVSCDRPSILCVLFAVWTRRATAWRRTSSRRCGGTWRRQRRASRRRSSRWRGASRTAPASLKTRSR